MAELPGLVQHTINQIKIPAMRQAMTLLAKWEAQNNVGLAADIAFAVSTLLSTIDARLANATYAHDLGAPDVADDDFLVTSTNMKNGAYTIEEVSIDVPRNITVARTVVGDANTPGKITVTGMDYAGREITEEIAVGGHGVVVPGELAFAEVTSIVGSGWAKVEPEHDTDTIKVGIGDLLGLPVALASDEDLVLALFDGAVAVPDEVNVADPLSVAGTTVDLSSETYDGTSEIRIFVRNPQ